MASLLRFIQFYFENKNVTFEPVSPLPPRSTTERGGMIIIGDGGSYEIVKLKFVNIHRYFQLISVLLGQLRQSNKTSNNHCRYPYVPECCDVTKKFKVVHPAEPNWF